MRTGGSSRVMTHHCPTVGLTSSKIHLASRKPHRGANGGFYMKTLRLRLTEDEKGWLERRAAENGRSMNAELRQLLKNSMASGHGVR
ncbi:FitA-like ribbon-helix-helix domain-containing protein [Pseudotabrizicola algicola]